MSEENKGVPFPRCLSGLLLAIRLTAVAMWKHRGELRNQWRQS